MLRSRVIPCLLIKNGGLVKTIEFENAKYVGDPINAVKIFNEKKVDELFVLDIDASRKANDIDKNLISKLASECRMPFCYGGGVNSVDQIEDLISLGVEKVAMSSALIDNAEIAYKAAKRVGSQSIIAVLDVKKVGFFKKYEIVTMNGTHKTGLDPVEFVKKIQDNGVGEIVINSVDNDGKMDGYDLELVNLISKVVNVPLTILGGAGSYDHIKELCSTHKIIGAAAGSFFVFKGKYRAVLINYLNDHQKESLKS